MFKQTLEEIDDEEDDEPVNEAFLAICEIISKMKQVMVIDPINGNNTQTLESLMGKSSSDWMNYPREHFKPFVTEESLQAIKTQVLLHKASIKNSAMVHDFKQIVNKLNELEELNRVLPMASFDNELKDCVEIVAKTWNKECDNVISRFKKSVRNHILSEMKYDVCIYKKLMDDVKKK